MEKLALTIGGATIPVPTGIQHINNTATGEYGEKLLQIGVTLMLTLVVLAALFYLVWGGIDWILSGGDKEGIAKARAKIMYAIIGIAVAFLSFFIITAIGYIFNVNLIFNPGIGSTNSTCDPAVDPAC